MQLKRYEGNPIMAPTPVNAWEAGSVFNPCVIEENGIYHMVYRATNDIANSTQQPGNYVSSIGYASSRDGIHFERRSQPLIAPTESFESGLGCEDPRLSKIDDTYYIFYTAVEGVEENKKVRIALATTKDLKHIEKHGIVGPSNINSKAAWLLGDTVAGKYLVYYTRLADSSGSAIFAHKFDSIGGDLVPPIEDDAGNDILVIGPDSASTLRGPEFGAPLIKTERGWLMIYCGSNNTEHKQWTINAVLLSLDDPTMVIAKLKDPILQPETMAEVEGVIKNVTFPTGAIVFGDELYVYYGSGDQGCCLATCKLNELLEVLGVN